MSNRERSFKSLNNMFKFMENILVYANLKIDKDGFIKHVEFKEPISIHKKNNKVYKYFIPFNQNLYDIYKSDLELKDDKTLNFFNPLFNYDSAKTILNYVIKKYIDEHNDFDDDQFSVLELNEKYFKVEENRYVNGTFIIRTSVKIKINSGQIIKIDSGNYDKDSRIISIFDLIYRIMGVNNDDILAKSLNRLINLTRSISIENENNKNIKDLNNDNINYDKIFMDYFNEEGV